MSTQDKLILVRLTASQWGSRKFDRQASQEVAAAHTDADASDVGRFNKILVDKESIKPVRQAYAELRNQFWFMTATWNDDGVRVLPAKLYFEFTAKMRKAREACDAAVADFCSNKYLLEVEAAKKRLGSLFRATDYPTRMEIESRFGVDIRFEPLPNPDDVRVWGIGDLAAAQVQKEVTANLERTIKESHQRVIADVMERAREYVEKVRKFDSEETKQLRTTALENLRDVVEIVLKGLNVTGDPSLTQFAEELEKVIHGVTVDKLRETPSARTKTTAQVEAVIGRFAGIFPAAAAQKGGAR